MNLFRVALLQMTANGCDVAANLEKAIRFCRDAKVMGADLALLPEMWSCGFPSDIEESFDKSSFRRMAVGPADSYCRELGALAADLKMAIAATFLEQWTPTPRNSVRIFDRTGRDLMTYAKVHTCDFGHIDALCTPGDDFPVCDLNTGTDTVKLGAMICYDREFPETARILMLNGAEIIVTPNACEIDELRRDQFKIRAFENAVGVAMTNYASPQDNGHSVAFRGDGHLVVEAGQEEEIHLAVFDMDWLREYRQKTIWGNAFRRPRRYATLLSDAVDEPFAGRRNAFDQPFVHASR